MNNQASATKIHWTQVQLADEYAGKTFADYPALAAEYRATGTITGAMLAPLPGQSTDPEDAWRCGPSPDEIDWSGLPDQQNNNQDIKVLIEFESGYETTVGFSREDFETTEYWTCISDHQNRYDLSDQIVRVDGFDLDENGDWLIELDQKCAEFWPGAEAYR